MKKGSSLLLAIFVVFILAITTFSLAKISLDEFKMSSFVDYSLASFYAAETGMENSLYEVRKNNTSLGSFASNEVILNNKSSWKIIQKDNPTELNFSNLKENETIQIDLFDPGSSSIGSSVDALKFSWTGSWLQINWVEWKWNTDHIEWSSSTSPLEEKLLSSADCSSQSPCFFTDFSPNKMYRVRAKALFGLVSDLKIKACGNDSCLATTTIKGRGVLESEGKFNKSKQRIKTEFSLSSPLSGIWDYVLFSEESLVK